jgi:hypothetical protein
MRTAKCVWPIENIDLEFPRAILMAKADLPRVLAENHWAQAGEPRGWREAEGTDAHGQDALYLVCDVDVELLPREPATATSWAHVGVSAASAA